MLENVAIDASGAIVFFNKICIDGHSNGCFIRFVTHVHSDHTVNLSKSLLLCKHISGTPITLDLLDVLGYSIPKIKKLPLNYDQLLEFENIRIRLYYSDHIPGSAQVSVEKEGILLAYTGDFKNPGSKTVIIKEPHVLIIDATYGDPIYVREGEDIIWQKFVELVKKLLSQGSISMYAYYGKAHEVMMKLREYGIDAPFLLSHSHWKVHRVLERYGYRIQDVFPSGSRESEEVRKTGWFIEVNHISSAKNYRNTSFHIILTGRFAKTIYRLNSSNTWIVGISGHADFNDIIYYVDESKPHLLIVDASRSSYAEKFASIVEEQLGIKSMVMPKTIF
ncbi:MBL fold metallo-hydrolase [Ignisphaera sp. 4213-co]|uniref:MBL fold metallo-hydrolase n=1 Tax=Ignisphaera cupida TaxID=3050454 RepID=A0ABD4Z722_9CREN|nr:MBL fold metallo-hydrolase [Ignisphaera sp. 4213-co]MDK6028398.1 MBL fold metallo-hydrolase [Ignisphaera sp. 4213-co]